MTGCKSGKARALWLAFGLLLAANVACAAALVEAPLFMYGAADRTAISQMADAGMNTAYLTPAGTSSQALADLERTIDFAADRNMRTIVAIPTVSHSFVQRPSPGPGRYKDWVTHLIEQVVNRFKDNPHVVAWATGDYLEDAIHYNVADFRAYLQDRYGDLESLNTWWESSFGTWGRITLHNARELDTRMPFKVGRASVDLARFRRDAFRRVMAHWATIIKRMDPDRPLITGRISLYRSTTAVPEQYDIVCPHMSPGWLESDRISHNVHGLDMARRGGRFEVLPALSIPLTEEDYDKGNLHRWVSLAALHGAVGIGLADYQRLLHGPAPQVIWRRLNRVLEDIVPRQHFQIKPTPNIAFLYEPIASGNSSDKEPAYGYLQEFSEGEPNNPFYEFRLGCVYGICDYLTVHDLPMADLDRYGVIMAPACLDLPNGASRQLAGYVRRGGALVCDLGAGVYQTGSWLKLPEPLAQAFGIRQLVKMEDKQGHLDASWPASWLPSVERGVESRPMQPLKPGKSPSASGAETTGHREVRRQFTGTPLERKQYHVDGPICYAKLHEGAAAVAVLATNFVDNQRVIAGLIGAPTESGVACFATHRLWANWDSGGPLYTAFHHDMCSRRKKVQLLGNSFWTTGVCPTATSSGAAFCNATPSLAHIEAICFDADAHVYTNAACTFSALDRTNSGQRKGNVKLSADMVPMSTLNCRRLPLVVQPYAGTCSAMAIEYDTDRIALELGGDGSFLRPQPGGEWHLAPGLPTDVRITVYDGAYRIAPGSKHRVQLITGNGSSDRMQVTASEDAHMRLSCTVGQARIVITPAAVD